MFTRRQILVAGVMLGLGGARAQALEGADFGLVPDADADQSEALSEALWRAAAQGRPLWLAPGRYLAGGVALPERAMLAGAPGTVLAAVEDGPVLVGDGVSDVGLAGVAFQGRGGAGAALAPDPATVPDPDRDAAPMSALVMLENCRGLAIEGCRFDAAPGHGLRLWASGGRIRDNRFLRCRGAAISAGQSTGLTVTGNDIRDCADLGIVIERDAPGRDGTILRANRIRGIGWASGGNGQYGNGITAFNAGALVIADNIIDDCAFSAIRLNTTRNAVVTGNICTRSGEVAIFAEFGFSGAVIGDNVIDDAAHGIAITNLDAGGHLATCSGNVVRNIRAASATNPDTTPVGISAEADTALTGNVVEKVPGVGLALGWGPYLRNVSVSANVLRGCAIGIGASVVQGAGAAVIAGNLVERPEDGLGIAGMEWEKVVAPDLTERAGEYPALALSGNTVVAAG